jgi:hypothetical protein
MHPWRPDDNKRSKIVNHELTKQPNTMNRNEV